MPLRGRLIDTKDGETSGEFKVIMMLPKVIDMEVGNRQ